ncbi:transcriptional regulator [Candidatus Roizmanbacteria bacterium]|nr:transcriptional regulator [Candidatus Roizmanbacteria bacterium]
MKNPHWLSELAEAFLNIKSKEAMKDFLYGILTPKELDQLSTRLQIVKMLKKGIPQHKISEYLKVGVATVTRGSRELQNQRFQNI